MFFGTVVLPLRSPFDLPPSTCDCDGDPYFEVAEKNKSVRTRNGVSAAVPSSC